MSYTPKACTCGSFDEAMTAALRGFSANLERHTNNEIPVCPIWETRVAAAIYTLWQIMILDTGAKIAVEITEGMEEGTKELTKNMMFTSAMNGMDREYAEASTILNARSSEVDLALKGKWSQFHATETTKEH